MGSTPTARTMPAYSNSRETRLRLATVVVRIHSLAPWRTIPTAEERVLEARKSGFKSQVRHQPDVLCAYDS